MSADKAVQPSVPSHVFADKVVVVTGASSGIGKALCLALAPHRPKLVLAARDEARLTGVAEACRGLGATTLVVPTDVASQDACQRLVTRTLGQFGTLDALVNNAGIGMIAGFEEVQDLSLYEDLMRVNYLGCVYPTYYALPALKKSRGRLVAVASLAGLTGVPTRTAYAASKHAVIGFFESLRIELTGTGVSVTIVAPDFVVSEIHERAAGPDGKPLGSSPLKGKIMTAEACAAMIVKAMERRERLVITSFRGRFGRWIKLIAPGVIDSIARRAGTQGR
jgi:short-subunit dehydrogenase